jgi:hypothetical protein
LAIRVGGVRGGASRRARAACHSPLRCSPRPRPWPLRRLPRRTRARRRPRRARRARRPRRSQVRGLDPLGATRARGRHSLAMPRRQPPAPAANAPTRQRAPDELTCPPDELTCPPDELTCPPDELTCPPDELTCPPDELTCPPAVATRTHSLPGVTSPRSKPLLLTLRSPPLPLQRHAGGADVRHGRAAPGLAGRGAAAGAGGGRLPAIPPAAAGRQGLGGEVERAAGASRAPVALEPFAYGVPAVARGVPWLTCPGCDELRGQGSEARWPRLLPLQTLINLSLSPDLLPKLQLYKVGLWVTSCDVHTRW